jgi:hypothetical protein
VTIDIDKLTEPELIDLNHRIVERLRFLQQMRAHKQMLEFKIGDRVAFQADGRGKVEGMLTRYNRKSVTIITDDGHHWNVAPALLSRAAAPAAANTPARSNVISLK